MHHEPTWAPCCAYPHVWMACTHSCPQVHTYVLMPGGRTAYLTELRSGSEVLVVSTDGSCRAVTVGRCKLERRPMVCCLRCSEINPFMLGSHIMRCWTNATVCATAQVLVEAVLEDGSLVSIILQNAETVKIAGSKSTGEAVVWEGVSVAELALHQKLLVHRCSSARHAGIAVDEFIHEQ